MKKAILTALAVVAGLGVADAQYSYSSASRLDSIENALAQTHSRLSELREDSVQQSIWRKGRYTNIGYSVSSFCNGVYERQNASYGVFINKGTSYLWPNKKAVGGMLKFGLDMRWFDLQFAGYKSYARPLVYTSSNYGNNYQGWTSDMTASASPNDNFPNYVRFNQYQLLAGLFGFGPTLTVAPLSSMDNAASSLRLNVYFHYQPTFGAMFYQGKAVKAASGTNPVDGAEWGESANETDVCCGYVSMMDFGFKVQWRNIGLGLEGRWGSGKMEEQQYHFNEYDYTAQTSAHCNINLNGQPDVDNKFTAKFGETRIYLDIVF